ncbi:proline dehydrogenase family protein [Xenorhabdus miraniensis]|uniref:Bifunctional proline dehydrogenase/pyrroline-5-carboxylate dehydrogenase n=1 Tax=Xenorhabdus miraniensis TaxID=351674 RepID=A0A2D0JRF9_9GAMM|nr:proline dehydrogenase family protein [Xenorhabdus miraniensis]PHM48853.1 bifunctional proline dehydrogenase/pyrroline-5-carboxylate dehydrogenase [Xenorhabdus miraniensis]
MKYQEKISLYSRYSTLTLLLKFIATLLLTNKFTKNISLKLVNFTINRKVKFITKFLNNVYFGGETLTEAKEIVNFLGKNNIYSVLDYAIEGENNEQFFDDAVESTLKLINFSSNEKKIPYVVIKPSSLGAIHIYEERTKSRTFLEENSDAWERVLARYEKIFSYAYKKSVRIMIDAEQSWVQSAVDTIAINSMINYNKKEPIITLTIQCYKKESLSILKDLHVIAVGNKIKVGVKLVRGAYLEEEIINHERAIGSVFSKKEETDYNYNVAVKYIAENIGFFSPFFATHNEVSISNILNEDMLKHKPCWMGQLYGIGDHISSNLVNSGAKVCKYLPYGPFNKSLPYLLRRINENAVSIDTFMRENTIIRKEIISRIRRSIK